MKIEKDTATLNKKNESHVQQLEAYNDSQKKATYLLTRYYKERKLENK